MCQPKDIDWLSGYKKKKRKKRVYILSTRDPHQTQGNIVTESEGMEEGIPHKWKLE